MYNQLPMIQVNQVRVPWIRRIEDLGVVRTDQRTGQSSSYIPYSRALAKIMKGSTAIGYYLLDDYGRHYAMESDTIKAIINRRGWHYYNLDLTKDKKLVHNPKGDRCGFDVSPDVFFNYHSKKYEFRVHYNSNEGCAIFTQIKTNNYVKYKVELGSNKENWILSVLECTFASYTEADKQYLSGTPSRVTQDGDGELDDVIYWMLLNLGIIKRKYD